MHSFKRIEVARPDGKLSVLVAGEGQARSVVVLHGMRDHAGSMSGLADNFDAQYHIVIPDLRGHGQSVCGGGYALIQFVADLRATILQCGLENPVLVGHSLGGHIVSRYAATYPDEVEALVLLDGMGPPSVEEPASPKAVQDRWLWSLEGVVAQANWLKPMLDQDEAVDRLCRNNPRLDPDMAQDLVAEGVMPHLDGGIRWKWDPTVNMVWQTFSHEESELLSQFIHCPTLIVTGDDALSYWTNSRFDRKIPESWYQQELIRRAALFSNAQSIVIKDAGHMLHYDQPAALNSAVSGFLASLPDG